MLLLESMPTMAAGSAVQFVAPQPSTENRSGEDRKKEAEGELRIRLPLCVEAN